MFTKDAIGAVIEELTNRKVRLYHACQFADFCSYLTLGGIPSRNLLAKRGLTFTKFESDASDLAGDIWTKIFLNLTDLGLPFAKLGPWTPLAYGPINLVVSPRALSKASDVAICLSSGASAKGREADSLTTLEDVKKLFLPSGQPWTVRFINELKDVFGERAQSNPEISCSIGDERIELGEIEHILCDPISIEGRPLTKWVRQELDDKKIRIDVRERTVKHTGHQELLELVSNGHLTWASLEDVNLSDALKNWKRKLEDKKYAESQFQRYASYLQLGTLEYIRSMTSKDVG